MNHPPVAGFLSIEYSYFWKESTIRNIEKRLMCKSEINCVRAIFHTSERHSTEGSDLFNLSSM